MRSPLISRRKAIVMAVSTVLVLMSCATPPKKAQPIVVDTTGVKDIGGLIAAIRKSGKDLLPGEIGDNYFFSAVAKSFVENARDAIERHGIQLPQWIVDRLPAKKISLEQPDKTEVMVFLTILGVVFVLPKLFLFSIVLGSILLMTKYISEELRKLKESAI